jgi:ATP-dependent Clp protease ATP-binding subunit ClpA
MFERYSGPARQAIFFARMEAGDAGATKVGAEHLLIGILEVNPDLPHQLGIELDVASLRNQSEHSRSSGSEIPVTVDMPIKDDLRSVLEHAIAVANLQQCQEVRTEHLMASLLEQGGHVAGILRHLGLEEGAMTSLLMKIDCSRPQVAGEPARQAMRRLLEDKKFS